MHKSLFLTTLFLALFAWEATASMDFEKDIITTSKGDLEITFIGHGSLMFTYKNIVVQVDPFSKLADYSTFPKANLILITMSTVTIWTRGPWKRSAQIEPF